MELHIYLDGSSAKGTKPQTPQSQSLRRKRSNQENFALYSNCKLTEPCFYLVGCLVVDMLYPLRSFIFKCTVHSSNTDAIQFQHKPKHKPGQSWHISAPDPWQWRLNLQTKEASGTWPAWCESQHSRTHWICRPFCSQVGSWKPIQGSDWDTTHRAQIACVAGPLYETETTHNPCLSLSIFQSWSFFSCCCCCSQCQRCQGPDELPAVPPTLPLPI